MRKFDVIVIGGGHAGIEACVAATQFDLNVALITMKNVAIGSAPCNPAIGGVGKGQVVREIDALGGAMGFLADKSGIQYRTLNESKGYAVRSTRIQIDKEIYPKHAEQFLNDIDNLDIIKEKVINITYDKNYYQVETDLGNYQTKKLVITVGTFLKGKLHLGDKTWDGGRVNAESSTTINELFSTIKKVPARFKTGTPARLIKTTINYDMMEVQPSDDNTHNFHLLHEPSKRFVKQIPCYLTYTNEKTMEIIRSNKEKSPMYNGQIKAVGARYCPSIEDKAYRYPDKNKHHVFVEPEGLDVVTMYPSGISSSLPAEIQQEFLNTIAGLENVKVEQYGYAVEYDVVDTTELKRTLEHKHHQGLYFAGQVNGTSGYEEAAGQGLVAGLNAALALKEKPEFILKREDSYIGVMIEDLVTDSRDEPYRLFTARSENRLYIREDNAFRRMWSYRTNLGLDKKIDRKLLELNTMFDHFYKLLNNITIAENDEIYSVLSINSLKRRVSIAELLKLSIVDPVMLLNEILRYYQIKISQQLMAALAITIKYEGYIQRSDREYQKQARLDHKKISWEELSTSQNISFECKQRIKELRPETFRDLRLIKGIRPATLAVVAGDAL